MILGEDLLLDDALRFAAIAARANVKVTLGLWPERFHVWHSFAAVSEEACMALDAAASFAAKVLK